MAFKDPSFRGSSTLEAAGVELRSFRSGDLARIAAWVREGDLARYMSRYGPHSLENGRWPRVLVRWWVILADLEAVGTLWLERGDHESRVAELGIFIAERDRRGLGLGRAAIALAFADTVPSWRLTEVRLRVRASNRRAIRCYRAAGFLPSGSKEKVVRDGKMVRVLEMTHRCGA